MDLAGAELWILPRVGLALVLSGAIGWEREVRDRSAGLRTHMLVGVAATLLAGFGEVLVDRYEENEAVRIDPLRIMEAIIAGVSFIGAGTIFVAGREQRVRGLTTAASLLATTVVALAAGLGLFAIAIATTTLLLIVLRALPSLEHRIRGDRRRGRDTNTGADRPRG